MITRSDMMPDGRPVFTLLAGCPRSGTSLLATELARRYEIAVPFETHFIPVFHRWRWLYGDLARDGNRARLLSDLYRFTRMWVKASKTFDMDKITQASILTTESRAADIVAASNDFASLIHAVFAAFADLQGVTAYADKSSFFSPVDPARFAAALGPVRVVTVVRDGRDVFRSAAKTWFGTGNVVRAARLWRRHIAVGDTWLGLAEAVSFTLRYEDLVRDPDKRLAEVAGFLGLTPRPSPVSPFLAEAMASAPEHARLRTSVGPATAGSRHGDLPQWQQDAFILFAGDALRRHGYNPGIPAKLTPRLAWAFATSLIPDPQRAAKNVLPLIFSCGGRGVLGRSIR